MVTRSIYKKLTTLMLLSVVVLTVNAQHKRSLPTPVPATLRSSDDLSANKSTEVNSGWFNFFDQLASPGFGLWLWNAYQDTNLANSQDFYYGWGVSFDPTDSAYSYKYNRNNQVLVSPSFIIGSKDPYQLDSLYINGKYRRNADYTDSLILELAVVTGTGNTFLYDMPGHTPGARDFSINADGIGRFADVIYDIDNNKISDSVTTTRQRYAMVLDKKAFEDTNTTKGLLRAVSGRAFVFTMNPPLEVPAGGKIVAYAHFKSGFKNPLGASIDNANYFQFYIGDPTRAGVYPPTSASNPAAGYPGSYQAAIFGDRYVPGLSEYLGLGHTILIPTYVTSPTPFGDDAPDWGFFLKCNTCLALDVSDVNNIIVVDNAYPVPAKTEVYIPFRLSTAAHVSITLSNAMGQIVKSKDFGKVKDGKASFWISDLPGGIYNYTINADNHQKTGRVVIQH